MVVPALSDTQLYDQKEHYSHKQLYSCSCRSSLFKLLHFFWSLLGVGFFLSCQCLLKFSDTLQRSSLVSAIQFSPPYVFWPFCSFYETVTRNLLWTYYGDQVDPQYSYIIIKKHLPCLFRADAWEFFPQNASVSDIIFSCAFLFQIWAYEGISLSFIGSVQLSPEWEGHQQKPRWDLCLCPADTATLQTTTCQQMMKCYYANFFIKLTFPFCSGSSLCVFYSIMSQLPNPFHT